MNLIRTYLLITFGVLILSASQCNHTADHDPDEETGSTNEADSKLSSKNNPSKRPQKKPTPPPVDKLKEMGLVTYDNPGGGNCFFYSVADIVYQIRHPLAKIPAAERYQVQQRVRNAIAHHLEQEFQTTDPDKIIAMYKTMRENMPDYTIRDYNQAGFFNNEALSGLSLFLPTERIYLWDTQHRVMLNPGEEVDTDEEKIRTAENNLRVERPLNYLLRHGRGNAPIDAINHVINNKIQRLKEEIAAAIRGKDNNNDPLPVFWGDDLTFATAQNVYDTSFYFVQSITDRGANFYRYGTGNGERKYFAFIWYFERGHYLVLGLKGDNGEDRFIFETSELNNYPESIRYLYEQANQLPPAPHTPPQ